MIGLDFAKNTLRDLVSSLRGANNLPTAKDTTVTRRDAMLAEAQTLERRQAEQDEQIELTAEAIREMQKARRRLIRERDQTIAERQAITTGYRLLEASWVGRKPEDEEEV